MAHLFVERTEDPRPGPAPEAATRARWSIAALRGDRVYELVGDARTTLRPRGVAMQPKDAGATGARGPLLLERRPEGEAARWIVVCAPGSALRMNGVPVVTGIRALRHRDELRLAGSAGRAFLSLEEPARVVAFDGPAGSICPRCRQEIAPGAPSVRCPRCGVHHHESSEFPCWTYAPTCALDDQPTDLDAGFRWSPTDLGHRD